MADWTYLGSDGLTHVVYTAPKQRSFHSTNWLLCTSENLHNIKPDNTGKVVACLWCLTTSLPASSSE